MDYEIEKRFKKIERLLRRYRKRLSRVASVAIPPLPIGGYYNSVDTDGVIMRFMFPCSGRIGKGYVMASDEAELSIMLDSVAGGSSVSIKVSRGLRMFDAGLKVDGGTILTVKSDKQIEGVWIGFLFHTTEGINIEKRLVTDLLELAERYRKEDEDEGI
ncbi:MAG: hypothetical protein DRP09_17695 [Candidatus Thorarchaeota archaeon]|nr:MAG: hypothetical protein DRP09_17695 [Candidatus Thorarchaeota archaeon]